MSFLKAEWRKLALANYEVDESLLKGLIPHKTELDKWNGITYLSLVGFMFKNTKIMGIKIPFHIDFEEVNLRFYVKYKNGDEWKRGVVFIKEIVPKPAITFIANCFYKEHYQTMGMRHLWEENNDERIIKYEWKHRGKWHSFSVTADKKSSLILENSEAEFITQHFWGYTKVNERTTFEYEVTHPKWEQYHVKEHQVNVDFGEVYGQRFKDLTDTTPASVMLAEGSEITVEQKRKI